MKKLNITKRDIRIFLFGMLIMLIIALSYDWKDFAKGISAGYNGVSQENVK